jgi:3-hydroxyisobutyrate dehydrogenase
MPPIIGFVGIGIMGQRMCKNLVKAGFEVHAYDLSPAAMEVAKKLGAQPAPDLPTLARRVDLVVSSLPDPAALLAVVDGPQGILAHLKPGSIVCDMSTADPVTARAVHAKAAEKKIAALDCPVSGGPGGAEAASLTIMVGGDAATLDRARPVFEAIGKNIIHCGGPGAGQAAKLVNQSLVAIHTAGLFEALLVGRKQGLDLDTMINILRTSSGASWMLDNHIKLKALVHNHEPGFALDLLFKDLKLFVQTATESQAPAFIAGAVLQLYNAARAAGHGKLDQTIVAREMEKLAGVELGTLKS